MGRRLHHNEELIQRISARQAQIGIVGLGYVGLPLARVLVEARFGVLGFDIDAGKVAKLSQGESYIGHIPAEAIRSMRQRGFAATDQFHRLGETDVITICVPTPLTDSREPDLQYVIGSVQTVARHLRKGQLIVLESTTYPGTTRQVILPILESTGLKPGIDFFLAYSPEREDPGSCTHATVDIPRVVGAVDRASLDVATSFYASVFGNVVQVSSPEVAEACKILENTYRAVNIALVNEMKLLYDRMGIDVWEVIDAAKTKPFGFQPFYPGPGLGGHCIPIDPFYLSWVARKSGLSTRLVELAGEINTAMPTFVVSKVIDALNECGKAVKGSKVLILGMAYKKDIDDSRESPGLELAYQLLRKGANVRYNDPHIPLLSSMKRSPELRMASEQLTPELLRAQDCVLIVTDHSAYEWAWIAEHSQVIVDTRNATRGVRASPGKIVRA